MEELSSEVACVRESLTSGGTSTSVAPASVSSNIPTVVSRSRVLAGPSTDFTFKGTKIKDFIGLASVVVIQLLSAFELECGMSFNSPSMYDIESMRVPVHVLLNDHHR